MRRLSNTWASAAAVFLGSCSCGGTGGGAAASGPAPAPVLTLEVGLKQLRFSWTPPSGATRYRLLENADGASGFSQLGGDVTGTSFTRDISVHRFDWTGARYRVEACGAQGCVPSNEVATAGRSAQAIGYFKASDTLGGTQFGLDLALSADGNTLAVGSPLAGAAFSVWQSGTVYVFTRSGGPWAQQAFLKASNANLSDQFGTAVALSADGNTLAVGAIGEASGATGVDGDQSDNSTIGAGAVYVFTRSGDTWAQQAYLKASNTGANDQFGWFVALSADGGTLAVGAPGESSGATGVNGNQADRSATQAGAVYVFTRSGTTWAQQAYLKASNTGAKDVFGDAVALSADGNTLAVGANNEGSGVAGVNGQPDRTMSQAGATYVFVRNGAAWEQQAYLKASNPDVLDHFGAAVALAADGNTLAVGACDESSAAAGVGGDQADNTMPLAGAVYVYGRSGASWTQQAYVKASNPGERTRFGWAVSLASGGNKLAVTSAGDSSCAPGVGGDQADHSCLGAGAAYILVRSGATWSQSAYLKASNPGRGDIFGIAVALDASGDTLAVGAREEASAAVGIGGNQADNSAPGAGAVYLY